MYTGLVIFLSFITFAFSESFSGYLRSQEISFCMDNCSEYYLENEDGEFINNFTLGLENSELQMFEDRYVEIESTEVMNCIECSALLIDSIGISSQCLNPVSCFMDPCDIASCQSEINNNQCIPNYCGGCNADFYDFSGSLVDCQQGTCMDLSGLDFGFCEMIIGVGYSNGSCTWISGCSDSIDGTDYSPYIFNSLDECEEFCSQADLTCDEITEAYEDLHHGQYSACQGNDDCQVVLGSCDVGLGGCYYSVNNTYDQTSVANLLENWENQGCQEWVCDCLPEPFALCDNGLCSTSWCIDDNPEGCMSIGCSDGYSCLDDYENSCVPSSCYCDEIYGQWYCTEDCGGGTCFLDGDINLDDQINVLDVVFAVNFILQITEPSALELKLSNLNGDDTLNVLDVIFLISLVLI